VLVLFAAGAAQTNEWADKFTAWHDRNEFRGYGHSSSADLAWWESYLLQAYLPMYQSTGDTRWLDRLVAHADTMFALMRDVPDTGAYWPGYRDGFLGWGTTRYDPNHQYQEYLVHDAHVCLPVARFIRLVLAQASLQPRYLAKARHYRDLIEQNVVAKWARNWNSDRGNGDDLEHFGGWRCLPLNEYLVFGELLLELDAIGASLPSLRTASFAPGTPDSMAAEFRSGLLYRPEHDAYAWHYYADVSQSKRWEDISHATLDLSFALAAHEAGIAFSDSDIVRFGNTLARTMSATTPDPSGMGVGAELPGFRRFVDGSGPFDATGNLAAWLRLAEHQPDCWHRVKKVLEACPDRTSPVQTSAEVALVLAVMAELQPLFPVEADPNAAVASESPGAVRQSPLAVSPNPCRSRITIHLPPSLQTANCRLALLDASGRCVQSAICNLQSQVRLDLGSLPAGVYLVRVGTGSQSASARLALLTDEYR
jgi:hypothetical protein